MGHFMTAQNLLLAIGMAPNLEREGFPSAKDLYPFKFHLEPLSQRSLAKYVTAEAPQDAIGIDDIVAHAYTEDGIPVNHVGNIYGLLGVVFATATEITAGGSGSPSWDEHLHQLRAAAYRQAPTPESWHLDDNAIDAQSLKFQAAPKDWYANGDVTIHQIRSRADAQRAIRQIAEQGEGPTDGGQASHFERFRMMYVGGDKSPSFPSADNWNPAVAVPIDPTPPATGRLARRSDRWADLADQRYQLLLAFIDHYLLTPTSSDRIRLSSWALDEMRNLNSLAATLTTLPQGNGVAAPPFTLPATLALPAEESQRWQLQRARTQAAIDHVHSMQADPADANDAFLKNMIGNDTARLAQMGAGPPAPVTTSFTRDILSLFRPKDIDHMKSALGLDLTDFDTVRRSATAISQRLKGIGGRRMPPPPDPPLSDQQIELFDSWVQQGCPA